MITKARRDEMRREITRIASPANDGVGETIDPTTVGLLLDSLDEMERPRSPVPAAARLAPPPDGEYAQRVTREWRESSKRWARQAGYEGAPAEDLLSALLALDEMERERDASERDRAAMESECVAEAERHAVTRSVLMTTEHERDAWKASAILAKQQRDRATLDLRPRVESAIDRRLSDGEWAAILSPV